MTEKGLKDWSNRKDSPHTEKNSMGGSLLSRIIKGSVSIHK